MKCVIGVQTSVNAPDPTGWSETQCFKKATDLGCEAESR